MGNGERGGDFTMAMSVLNQEALERNQNTLFFFFFCNSQPPLFLRNLEKTHFSKIR